ncbi:sensor histidine kinase [Rubellimicrobium roseum]|uniref:histidine kinase n=1 Tax=Rubellimicrobium roseum TaxID=687525 RepID=A0A5C4NIT8_9RHOB|nr:sensor histidine kinase [Rubellimicrobium roseum]TNC73860.1 sensor histidine kinase [Rubellimicrobium roseum]
MTETPRPWWRLRLDGLALRVATFLTIALLPLGLIALWQTREYQRETERRAELSLLAVTEQGAAGVAQLIERARGAGESLAVVADLLDDPDTCSDYLGRLVAGSGPYNFVGFVPASGPVTCSSSEGPVDLGGLIGLGGPPRVHVQVHPGGLVSGEDVLIIAVPVGGEAAPQGYLAFSVSRERAAGPPPAAAGLRPQVLLTFDVEGEVLTVQPRDLDGQALMGLLAQGRSLAQEASDSSRVYEAIDAEGEDRVYTVAPLVPDVAYAMAVWSPQQAGQGIGPASSPLLFPLLMWATSLLVAFWAIHRLVIRRVARLGVRMRRFGRDRSLDDRPPGYGTPHELREIEDAFRQMATAILHDEARMENAFRERGVLLREVHHRVKNNLQLISSIISMQIRRMPEARVRAILRRLQDRVLTLASIYRSLYTSPDMGDVNAAPVLRAIVEQELRGAEGRVEATLDIEDIVLDPDKVVPLAFLTAEAVSNALVRAAAAEGRPSLSIALHRDGERATLRIANSVDGTPAAEEPPRGLGQHLIQAFAAQVGGPARSEVRDGLYRLSVTFPIDSAAEHETAEA